MSIRTERVKEEIKKTISELLVRDYRDRMPGLVTIQAVDISPDLRSAAVFYSVFGTDAEKAQIIQIFKEETKTIRFELGREIRLKRVPELVFKYDDTSERAARIFELVKAKE